jgi:hypothetical protein
MYIKSWAFVKIMYQVYFPDVVSEDQCEKTKIKIFIVYIFST